MITFMSSLGHTNIQACEILKNYIDKNEYTLELHCEMKQMYENLGTYIFTNGTKRKRSVTKKLYVAIWTSIREGISSFSRFQVRLPICK